MTVTAAESTAFALGAADGPGRLLIDGAWTAAASGETFEVRDPGTGEVVAQVAHAAEADVDAAVAAARRAFEEKRWRSLSGAQRGVVLWRVSELITQHLEEFARLESLDVGIPVSQARLMMGEAANAFRYYAGWADKIDGRSVEIGSAAQRFQGYTLKEPVGVAGLIVAWNAPMVNIGMKLPAALAAGCACVLKPSEQAPLTSLALGRLLREAGLPDGVVNIVTGFAPAGAALAGHEDVDKISFTGSVEVGRKILRAAEGNLKKVTLELGGKSPVLVLPDADLAGVFDGVAKGVFWNSGQICTSGTRLLVHRDVYDEVVQGVADAGRALRLGYGTDPDADLGPLISQQHLERVSGYVHSGVEEGATVVSGGRQVGDRGYFYEPTVVADARPDMRMIREEIFGPVIGAMSFEDVDEAIAVANGTSFGLAASVWSRDASRAHRIAREIKAGRVGINVHRAGGVQMPVGGYKQSGWGHENGPEGLDEYLETKSVISILDR
ncbi:aldehyde dehydrogenase [Amycolatopsis sp. Poz14]|uniref:aldehyde dehydrogenase family protein n=1 Tax=Amycolatopsis sp. Poz14 TaxID=1447705 RepID=UPI001EE8D110|nr:aldehyde dehydrogenase family protein [Amycolatopsis sp. Poz14]MCG3753940.1 aldehyde dehydrogenase family protein [Amycolatopsis sp. Poz14]